MKGVGNFFQKVSHENPPRKTNFVERLAVVGPKRLRELLLCQRAKETNSAKSVLHEGFYQNAEHLRGKGFEYSFQRGCYNKGGKSSWRGLENLLSRRFSKKK